MRRAAPLSRYAFRNPDGNLSSSGQAWVTLFAMTVTGVMGFYCQQKLLDNYRGPEADLNAKVKEIRRLELLELQLATEREAERRRQGVGAEQTAR